VKKNVFFVVFMVDEKNYGLHSLVPWPATSENKAL
jgi:hypothetical protein